MGFIFLSGGGGGGYFWEVVLVVGVHRPRHLIFTLFQSNTVWHEIFAVFVIFSEIRKIKFQEIKNIVNIFPQKFTPE